MESAIELTDGKQALQLILDERPPESDEWNEAQNRFHFIDRLLKECLGWTHPYMDVEKTDESGGRADYHLGRPLRAVLEAKREAVKFQFPPTIDPRKARKVSGLIASCPNFARAFEQIIPYCAREGASLGIICNGPQTVIFRALTPERKPSEGWCYAFDGFSHYLKFFPLLWGFLSPEGIATNRVAHLLTNDGNQRIPVKASSQLSEPLRYRFRTDFQENLRVLATVLLDSIEENDDIADEFDQECYVDIKANKRHLLLSKNSIAARYDRSAMDGVKPSELSIENGNLTADVLFAGRSPKPVVVLGDVGVGKTSFFKHLFGNIRTSNRDDAIFIRIDLGKSTTLSNSLQEFLVAEIPMIIRRQHDINLFADDFASAVYRNEIADFSSGPAGRLIELNKLEYLTREAEFVADLVKSGARHLTRSLEYLTREKKKQVILVIDNADQRDYETQQQAFLAASEFATIQGLMAFVCLRPSTFYRSKRSGALSGYETKVFTISPPPAEEVIRKRLTFGLRVAEGKAAPAALQGVRLNLSSIVLFLRASLRSVNGNSEIKTFLSNITGGNTRQVIELVTGFVGSPNVESEKIVSIEERTGNYRVPLHEFTKHALLGEYAYYNPESSQVALNIFDVSVSDRKEHFLQPILVAFLGSGQASKNRDGFVAYDDIEAEMTKHGFSSRQVSTACKLLAFGRLIETPFSHFRELDDDSNASPTGLNFRSTSIGAYHVRYWSGSFSFLDAMAIETPVFDEGLRRFIFEHAESFAISDRLKKASAFRDYLADTWNGSSFDTPYYDFIAVLDQQDETFLSVERVVIPR